MVAMQEGVTSQWSQVENQYQRRADLIPNLVNTVKGYAEHEKSTLDAPFPVGIRRKAIRNFSESCGMFSWNQRQNDGV